MDSSSRATSPLPAILETVARYWGYNTLRPLQAEAIQAGLARRDSLVVMPTGGGKSLCYQVPAAVANRTDVVVSPLISLMKDQVDALRQCGYPATALHSAVPGPVQRKLEREVAAGRYRLVFAAPERLLAPGFMELLTRVGVRAFAIDEAHCISHWGHDFRPEYRRLAVLKQRFPQASVHAYTATATERVRRDIVAQLGLRDPTILVGTFDRPNLVYRVIPRVDLDRQVFEVIARHPDQAVIVYCISRKDTERLTAVLQRKAVRAACYHAGLGAEQRRATQERFSAEEVDVIVATVAFGMGIDRSDVRCVIHAAMPKSIEHYQQETGRAGRDGLEAECVLFYSPQDAFLWQRLLEKSSEEAAQPQEVMAAGLELLGHMRGYAAGRFCRHKTLSGYFGQPYERSGCAACDVCLGEVEVDQEATLIAQKILSCVARVEQRFGIGHVVKVLRGVRDRFVRSFGHDRLSTFGLLKEQPANVLTNLVHQLVDQGVLDRTSSDRPLLKLNALSWEILRGQRQINLIMPRQRVIKATRIQAEAWHGVDRDLFESLRGLRRQVAAERGVPACTIFGDAALRDMARRCPRSQEEFRHVHGVGPAKLRDLGQRFVGHIDDYCRRRTSSS
jgi:ATP-dependent DNA helicase RecQ